MIVGVNEALKDRENFHFTVNQYRDINSAGPSFPRFLQTAVFKSIPVFLRLVLPANYIV